MSHLSVASTAEPAEAAPAADPEAVQNNENHEIDSVIPDDPLENETQAPEENDQEGNDDNEDDINSVPPPPPEDEEEQETGVAAGGNMSTNQLNADAAEFTMGNSNQDQQIANMNPNVVSMMGNNNMQHPMAGGENKNNHHRQKWNPMHFVGEFEDSLGHRITSVEVPPRNPTGPGMKQPEPSFHAHFVARNRPDKRFVIARKQVMRSQKRAWMCGNGYFCHQLSNPDRIVFQTIDGRENVWTRLPPAGAVFFDPPPNLTIDVDAAMAQWREEHLKLLEQKMTEIHLEDEQAIAEKEQQQQQILTEKNDTTEQQEQLQNNVEKVENINAVQRKEKNDKNTTEKQAFKTGESTPSTTPDEESKEEPSATENKKSDDTEATSWAAKLKKSTETKASSSTATKQEKKDTKPVPKVMENVEKSWPPKKWAANANAEEFFPACLELTRPRVSGNAKQVKELQVRAVSDVGMGNQMFSELQWTLEEKWSQLKKNPTDFAVVSPHFSVGVVENLQLSFFPSGRKASGKKSKHTSLQLITGDLQERAMGLELEIMINGIRCETAKKTVSGRFTGDYPSMDDKTEEVKICLRIINLFKDEKKIEN
ncbi:unnamed protein product [Amoebophrya sp. A120]|nr:unnamed protein product [Amoebophrya sp. A120]|eukprot:GSA120T00009745001.1